MATFIIPTPLRKFTKNQAFVKTPAKTVRTALQTLISTYSGLHDKLFDEQGKLYLAMRIYVGHQDIADLQGYDTPLEENVEISLIPAYAG